MGDDGDECDVSFGGNSADVVVRRQQVGCGEMLCGKDPVKRIEGKLAPGTQEVGEMGLAQTGLTRQKGHADRSPLNPAQQLLAQTLVHLSKVHLWKISFQQ